MSVRVYFVFNIAVSRRYCCSAVCVQVRACFVVYFYRNLLCLKRCV